MAEQNEVPLTKELLLHVLDEFSKRILQAFGRPIRLVVHGGAVMILHPNLKSTRATTRDVDFIERSFITEMASVGMHDAQARLQTCIALTATNFRLGADWMNSHADVALPMATDPTTNRTYDPIYHASIQANNVHLNTIYSSPGLALIAVAPFWGVALKMVRYAKDDPEDIKEMLIHGTRMNGVQWAPHILEKWLLTNCWPMGYMNYPSEQIKTMREKITHAVTQACSTPPSHSSAYPQAAPPPPPPFPPPNPFGPSSLIPPQTPESAHLHHFAAPPPPQLHPQSSVSHLSLAHIPSPSNHTHTSSTDTHRHSHRHAPSLHGFAHPRNHRPHHHSHSSSMHSSQNAVVPLGRPYYA
ncbi:hypothetical protein PLICRDRAFT_57436 [Plicaturopsis crispa FD-325 SS-3]|uniref:Unplaced genomic scaffold PLICRscaffold_16, whole genome shotgun sequence n=1 Tax=Plicaturopsis crispa FD-325 SS-3 TaxID=944288 RepID=A0A0C9SYB3_PLICR|nr:hypothetical protein PLICRDRAFT_57436 [Plicaturopsis crispa FD-325 SS-3]